MKIEIWSDYACPYCYIGKRHLQQALARFEHREHVEIAHKAFELYPDAGPTVRNTTQQRIEAKYRKSPDEARQMIAHIEQLASRAGLTMNYAGVQNTNTFDAHRLTKVAARHGKANEMDERLLEAYFTANLPLADRNNLLQIAQDAGLDRSEIERALDDDTCADAVRDDERQAALLGIQGVPFFLIDGKIALSGAQPAGQLLAALQQGWEESTRVAPEPDPETFCTDTSAEPRPNPAANRVSPPDAPAACSPEHGNARRQA